MESPLLDVLRRASYGPRQVQIWGKRAMSMLGELAAFVVSANARDLPARDQAILRRHAADVVAARLAGEACSAGEAVAAFYAAGEEAESIAGLAALVRLTETDDIHAASGTTPSSVAVPVALGLAATKPCDPDRLASAILVGIETIVRLGRAVGGAKVLYKGIWPTRAGATLGAAAAACRIWELSEPATRNALSMALMYTAGHTGRFKGEPSGRWLIFGSAVAGGIRAAQAARAGFNGDPDVLEGGFLERLFGTHVEVPELVRNLGRASVLSELSLKPYCSARQALPGAEAMRALVAEGLDPDSIEAFTIKVPSVYVAMISQNLDPAIHSSSYVSGAGLAAIAALDPSSLYDLERANVWSNPRIIELAKRGEVVADPVLDRLYPGRWPAAIEVKTRSRTFHHTATEPIGDPGNPIGDRELADKARRILTHLGRADCFEPWQALTTAAFDSHASASALARFFVDGTAS
jgi:2-methylcitrate dehydratase PrpD